MAGDWVKSHRSLLDSKVFKDSWHFHLFWWCVLKANYKPDTFKGHPINTGEFVTGRLRGADELGVSPSKWYRGIQTLSRPPYSCIKVKSNSEWTIITVCNYKTYQSGDTPKRTASEQQVNSERTASDTTSGQPADTIEEVNNPRREEFSLSLTLADGEFEFPQRWRIPSLVRALGNWASHIQAQNKPFQKMHLEGLLLHHAQAGWSAEKLERGINKSLGKVTATTILDPDEEDRSTNGTGGRRQKDYTP